MKAIIFISASVFGLFLSSSAFAQTDKAASQLDIETKSNPQVDLLVPQKEPAHIIGDDGQKVYFLVDPSKVNTGNSTNSTQIQNGAIQPKSKPE
ncbi:MAG: hypothetical protein ACKPAD_02925 [Bacteroidota bacterium]